MDISNRKDKKPSTMSCFFMMKNIIKSKIKNNITIQFTDPKGAISKITKEKK